MRLIRDIGAISTFIIFLSQNAVHGQVPTPISTRIGTEARLQDIPTNAGWSAYPFNSNFQTSQPPIPNAAPYGDDRIVVRVKANITSPQFVSAAPVGGTLVYKWDEPSQSYLANTKIAGVWPAYLLMTLYPGEGCIVDASSGFTAKFVGRIRQNWVEKAVSSQSAIHSTMVPLAGAVDANLGFPIANGDSIYVMIDTSGHYQTYTYNNGSWSPVVPNIPRGTAFWSYKAVAAKWRQNFSVW